MGSGHDHEFVEQKAALLTVLLEAAIRTSAFWPDRLASKPYREEKSALPGTRTCMYASPMCNSDIMNTIAKVCFCNQLTTGAIP